MLTKAEINRYDRQIKLPQVGSDGQERLKNAHVTVVGAGGLGCPCITYLAAAGVGSISIIDGDKISESNLARQTLYSPATIGEAKVTVAVKKILEQNPNLNLTPIAQYLDAALALETFKTTHIVIDCTDNFATRYLIADVCRLYYIPYVSAALFRMEAQIAVYNLTNTREQTSYNYNEVFPLQEQSVPALNCNDAGVLATLPGIAGVYQANEVLKYFLDKDKCLFNQMLFINAWTLQQHVFDIDLHQATSPLSAEQILARSYEFKCTMQDITEVESLHDITTPFPLMLIDIREMHEVPDHGHLQITRLPFSAIEEWKNKLDESTTLVLCCVSGKRSLKAAEIINETAPGLTLISYKHGIHKLLEELEQIQEELL